MKTGGRLSISVLLFLAVIAGMSGIAGCATCLVPAGTVMPCCGHGGAPALHAVSCCRPQASAPLPQTAQGVTPAPALLSAPAALSVQTVPAPRVAEPVPVPPPLHEGVGLYTLNSTFLI